VSECTQIVSSRTGISRPLVVDDEALHVGKRRMRPDFDAVSFRQPHRLMHDRRVGGVEAAGNIGEVDMRHQRGVIAEPIKPETFAHIAVDGHAHSRDPSCW
jgi:hypothetical protein